MKWIFEQVLWYIPDFLRPRLWKLVGKFTDTIKIQTNQGLYTISTRDNSIGRRLFCNRVYEIELIIRVLEFLREKGVHPQKGQGTVLDIGANNGFISLGMLCMKEVQEAIALEPEPFNFSLLKKNVRNNKFEDLCKCFQYALSDEEGEQYLELSDTNYGDHRIRNSNSPASYKELYNESKRPVINVTCETLDRILDGTLRHKKEDISLVWVDTQGYEGYIFKGGEIFLKSQIPVVSEIWPYGIARSGMSQNRFCAIVSNIWPTFWVLREGDFINYPTKELINFINELGEEGVYDNVILTS